MKNKVSPGGRRKRANAGGMAEDFMASGDFDVSISASPGKLDRNLEKMMNE